MSWEDTLNVFRLDQLEELRDTYEARHDRQKADIVRAAISRRDNVQTELSNCGQLFKHRNYDEETGRLTHSWTGDPSAWMRHFQSPGISVRVDSELFTGRNSERGRALRAKREAALEAAGLK